MAKKIRILCALFISVFMADARFNAQDLFNIDSVFNGLTTFSVTNGSFVQRRTAANLKRPLESKGTFIICELGISWKTETPVSSQLCVTKDKIIQITPDGKKNIIDGSGNPTFKNIAETLATLFSGNKEVLEKKFYVDFSSEADNQKQPSDEKKWTIVLKPKDSTIATVIKSIILNGTTGPESFINSVEMNEQESTKIVYYFSNQIHRNVLTEDEKSYFAVK